MLRRRLIGIVALAPHRSAQQPRKGREEQVRVELLPAVDWHKGRAVNWIRDRVAPPTLNLDNPSVATAIDLVPHQARHRTIDTVLSNSFGFGGTNASLVFRRIAS